MSDTGNLAWLTHEEAGCTDPRCRSAHARLAPDYPQECSACGFPFPDGEGGVRVLLTPPDSILIEAGAVMAQARQYHARCYPGTEAAEAMRAEIWPPAASLGGSRA